MKSWLAILAFIIFSKYFLSIYLTYFFIALLIYKILKDLHIIGEVKFALGTFKKSKIYFINFKGSYKNVNSHFINICSILTKFKLDDNYDIAPFGIYYDNPKKVNENECRAILGLMIINDQSFKDIEDYLISEGYNTNKVEHTACVVSRVSLVHKSMIFLAIIRYYKDLERKLLDSDFIRQYRIGDTNNIPAIIEVYKKNLIEFFVPTSNQDGFKFYTDK